MAGQLDLQKPLFIKSSRPASELKKGKWKPPEAFDIGSSVLNRRAMRYSGYWLQADISRQVHLGPFSGRKRTRDVSFAKSSVLMSSLRG